MSLNEVSSLAGADHSYVSPSGYPVVLDYKKVEIDDTNTFLWLFSDDATFNEFKVES